MSLIATGALVALLTGCTSDDPDPTGSPSGAGTATQSAPDALSERYLTLDDTPPIAETTGTLPASSGPAITAKAAILAVTVSESSTVLTWRLSASTDGVRPAPSALAAAGDTASTSTSGVVLVTTQTPKRLYQPNHYQLPQFGSPCTCSPMPSPLNTAPAGLSSVYPALPASETQVEVRIPGLKAVTVPVTRS